MYETHMETFAQFQFMNSFLSVQVPSCLKVSFGKLSRLHLWVVCAGLEPSAVRWTGNYRVLPYL